MTREEAKKSLLSCTMYDYGMDAGYDEKHIDWLIDKIYRDIEHEICLNCKYLQNEYEEDIYCDMFASFFKKDFGCKKWESKDD